MEIQAGGGVSRPPLFGLISRMHVPFCLPFNKRRLGAQNTAPVLGQNEQCGEDGGIIKLYYDLHMHSCLSLCAEEEMTPNNMVNMAVLAGLDVMAVSDHQSARNAPAVLKAAQEAGIVAIPGLELQTSEEVHVLCLFYELSGALAFSDYVKSRLVLPPGYKNTWRQSVMDEKDNIIEQEETYLGTAADIGIYDAAALVRSYGGIAMPAHIDRPSASLLANLGFYDPMMGFSLCEVSRYFNDPDRFALEHPELGGLAYITNSDAHALADIPDAANVLEAEERSVRGVLDALAQLSAPTFMQK